MRDRDGREASAHHKQAQHAAGVPGRKIHAEAQSPGHARDEMKAHGDAGESLFKGLPWSREEEDDEDEKDAGEHHATEHAEHADDTGDADGDGDDGDDGDGDDGDGDDAEHEHEGDEEKAHGHDAHGTHHASDDDAKHDAHAHHAHHADAPDGKHAKHHAKGDGAKEDEHAHHAKADHDSDADADIDEQSEEEIEADESDDDEPEVRAGHEHGEAYSEGQEALDRELVPDGEGERLDSRVQHRLEQETGYSLEGVRIHAGGETEHKLREHGILGAAKGRNILLADSSKAQDYDLVRHEVNHVIQQASGKVSGKLGAGERAKHEADADRHTHKRHHELKDLSAPATGPAQFRLAYDGPPPSVTHRKPQPARRPPPPPPRPTYSPAVVQKRSMGSDYRPPAVRRPPQRPTKPKPYSPPVGDQHWKDPNLRGQSVDAKVQRWKQKHSHQQALANRDARKTGGDPVQLMPKLPKQDKRDLRAFRKSTRLAQEGVIFAKGIREKREADERRRQEDERKKKDSGGFFGGLKKAAKGVAKVAVKATHVGLDVASYVPGPVGSGASAANAGIYFAEGNNKAGKEKLIEAAAGLIPIPGSKVAGKLVLKGAQAGAKKIAIQKATGKTGARVITAARRARKMIKQNRRSIMKAGEEMYGDAIKDQGKAVAKDKAGVENYNFGTALLGTATGKAGKRAAGRFPLMDAKKAKSLAKKRVAMLPIPKNVARKLKTPIGDAAEGSVTAPANKVADEGIKVAMAGGSDDKKKKKKKP